MNLPILAALAFWIAAWAFNEWLVRNAPYLRAELAFSAESANWRDARLLQAQPGQALLILSRITWNDLGPITIVRVAFQPGHHVANENGLTRGY